MKKIQNVIPGLLLAFLLPLNLIASNDTLSSKIGLSFTSGRQQMFPFNSRDYSYDTKGIKLIYNYSFGSKKLHFEFQAEPSIYRAEHQLLQELFVQPADGPDFLAKRETFTKLKTFTEITANIGLIIRYSFTNWWSIYWIGSVGPMYSGIETERLASGFAFSDLTGIGASLRVRRFTFDIRPGIRHVSNADLKQPNSGHNSTTLDAGVMFEFRPKRK